MPTDQQISLTSTIRAFNDGVTSLSPTAAVTVIEGWIDKIADAGKPELGGVADLLGTLRDQLQADRLDGQALGTTMQRLGAHTAESARLADDDAVSGQLTQLGSLIASAGVALGGGRRPDKIEGVSTDRSDPTVPDPIADAARSTNAEMKGDATVLPEDETPGTTFHSH